MIFLLVVALLLDSSVETGYDEAYRKSIQEDKPLVVIVGAERCPACVDVKRRILPKLFQRFQRNRFCYAEVNCDNQPELAEKLMNGTKTIPQITIFYKENGNWRKKRWIGSKEVEIGLEIEIQRLTK